MQWYIIICVPGSDTCIYVCQETMYRSKSCKRKLRKNLACGPPGIATQVHHAKYYAIACRPTWLVSSELSPPFLHLFVLKNLKIKNIICKPVKQHPRKQETIAPMQHYPPQRKKNKERPREGGTGKGLRSGSWEKRIGYDRVTETVVL